MSERFSFVSSTDVLRGADRHRKPIQGDATLVLSVEHRTTGGGRSILLTREQVQALRHQLGEWLDWAAVYHDQEPA